MGRNLPHFMQYTQTFHLLFLPEVDASTIDDPVVSARPCFLGCFSLPDTRQSLASSASRHHLSASACKRAALLACAISAICSQLTHSSHSGRTLARSTLNHVMATLYWMGSSY